ncbi:MarR family winged helix-turn-helix transcriptional regulator [Luedemannella helvata]|uniref:HTH marR-type domain-containing protein n=1 Tax=Luedemannella helvata TaxID=349315 RepID=A0ABN2KYJ8_9ACTN
MIDQSASRPSATSPDERNVLIERIMSGQQLVQRMLAEDRSNPLLNSHLTMSQLKILLLLRLHGGSGGQELARHLGVSLATMTGIVDRLVAQGLVTRHEDPHDRRVRRIELDTRGREMIDHILTAGEEHQRRLMNRIDLAGLRVIDEAVTLLRTALAAELADRPDGPASDASSAP